MMWGARAFAALVAKDLRSEVRSRQFFISSVALGVILMLIMGMATRGDGYLDASVSAGVLWALLFFAIAIHFSRHDRSDSELSAYVGVRCTPVDRSLIYYAKWCGTCVFTLASETAISISFFIILNQPLPEHFVAFLSVLLAGALGLGGIGTFVSTLVADSSLKEVLIPLTVFPLAIPLFLALTQVTIYSFGGVVAGLGVWGEVTVGYIVCFTVLPWLLIEALMEV